MVRHLSQPFGRSIIGVGLIVGLNGQSSDSANIALLGGIDQLSGLRVGSMTGASRCRCALGVIRYRDDCSGRSAGDRKPEHVVSVFRVLWPERMEHLAMSDLHPVLEARVEDVARALYDWYRWEKWYRWENAPDSADWWFIRARVALSALNIEQVGWQWRGVLSETDRTPDSEPVFRFVEDTK